MNAYQVTAEDVEWIDCRGEARVNGHTVTRHDLKDLEQLGDRDGVGKLTQPAKLRLARRLTLSFAADRLDHIRYCDG